MRTQLTEKRNYPETRTQASELNKKAIDRREHTLRAKRK